MPNMKKKKKAKKVTVDRKFLTRLADSIYNPKTKSFLRLCDGSLQDETDGERPMHCGLGELYVAMTGREPHADAVDENDVVVLAMELSPLTTAEDDIVAELNTLKKKAVGSIKRLDLPKDIASSLVELAESAVADMQSEKLDELEHTRNRLRDILNDIPNVNDGCANGNSCTIAQYRKRSKCVAAKLREAASLL